MRRSAETCNLVGYAIPTRVFGKEERSVSYLLTRGHKPITVEVTFPTLHHTRKIGYNSQKNNTLALLLTSWCCIYEGLTQ